MVHVALNSEIFERGGSFPYVLPPNGSNLCLGRSGEAPEADSGLHEMAYLEGRTMSEAMCPWCDAFEARFGVSDDALALGVTSLSMAVLPSELCADCRQMRRGWLRAGKRHYLRSLQ